MNTIWSIFTVIATLIGLNYSRRAWKYHQEFKTNSNIWIHAASTKLIRESFFKAICCYFAASLIYYFLIK